MVAALLIAALCQARDVRSPNGSYAIRAENSISLVDLESGSTLMVLDKDASGESRVEVAWAPNSMKVAIVEDEARGSVVLGAWTDERSIPADMASDPEFLKGPSDVVDRPATWHKTIQDDNEKAIFSEANAGLEAWLPADGLTHRQYGCATTGKHAMSPAIQLTAMKKTISG